MPAVEVTSLSPSGTATGARTSTASSTLGGYQEQIREAMNCLESSNRRLKRGTAEQTDEALRLLTDATAHLRAALTPTE